MLRVWGIVLAAVAVAALPATAAAKPGYYVGGPGGHAKLRFTGSNGYGIEVQAQFAKKGALNVVLVTAKDAGAAVTYVVRGSLASDGSLDVHLPHVGRIAVEFDPVHDTRRGLPENCNGRASVVEHGYFRGSIELHGEREFTTVERSSVHGQIVHSFRRVCHVGKTRDGSSYTRRAKRSEEPSFTFLEAERENGSVDFLALEATVGGKTIGPLLSASKRRSREGMFIVSTVTAKGKAGDLTVSEPGKAQVAELATVPAPFEGSGTFTLTSPKTSTWKGDLAVELPAVGRVALAGKEFSSILCTEGRCTKTGGEAGSIVGGIFG